MVKMILLPQKSKGTALYFNNEGIRQTVRRDSFHMIHCYVTQLDDGKLLCDGAMRLKNLH